MVGVMCAALVSIQFHLRLHDQQAAHPSAACDVAVALVAATRNSTGATWGTPWHCAT